MTLIELVIAIVVIAIAASAVLGLLSRTTETSADAMIVAQAGAIAEAYLEEITLRSFDDPDGVDGEASRGIFDDVDDYDGLTDVGARDQFGNAIASLGNYTVSVSVSATSALTGIPSTDALRIDVRVTQQPYVNFMLTSYRTR